VHSVVRAIRIAATFWFLDKAIIFSELSYLIAGGGVMQKLSKMGITADSLFPGLDGACEELRERNFSFQPSSRGRFEHTRISDIT
jgi:hypothetical protein